MTNNTSTAKNFYNISDTARMTGLSSYWIRQQLKAGKLPHVRCGNRYLVNLPAMLEVLNAESESNAINTGVEK